MAQREVPIVTQEKKEILYTLLEVNGFLSGREIRDFMGRRQSTIFREMLREVGLREHIVSTGHGVKTNCGRKYSSWDLFGRYVYDPYFVGDFDAFKDYGTKKYSVLFATANPFADRDLIRAYTRFMRKNLLDAPRPTLGLREYA
ncbi:MAG: hypothetical protein KGH66_01575 [Candidatus Micrarchaeota archaeon]|nr:hypothetical protein [Candidatus Micrarchaeota archaeon]